MSDLPMTLSSDIAMRLRHALDRERKIERALEALGPVAGRDVLVIGGGPDELARYVDDGARVTAVDVGKRPWPVPSGSIDTIVSVWSGFRGVDQPSLDEVDRVLRPDGRLLVVHDYGRDDVSRLRGDLPEYGAWSRRDGPFLGGGFRVRVIHCFWTFDGLGEARAFLESAFGPAGRNVGSTLKRPRLSYNVAIYHRTRGGEERSEVAVGADAAGATGGGSRAPVRLACSG